MCGTDFSKLSTSEWYETCLRFSQCVGTHVFEVKLFKTENIKSKSRNRLTDFTLRRLFRAETLEETKDFKPLVTNLQNAQISATNTEIFQDAYCSIYVIFNTIRSSKVCIIPIVFIYINCH